MWHGLHEWRYLCRVKPVQMYPWVLGLLLSTWWVIYTKVYYHYIIFYLHSMYSSTSVCIGNMWRSIFNNMNISKRHHGVWIDILLFHLMKRLNIPRSNHFNINFWKIIIKSHLYIWKKKVFNGKVSKILVYVALNGNLYGFPIYYPYPWQNGFKATIQTLHMNKHKNEYINIQCLKKCAQHRSVFAFVHSVMLAPMSIWRTMH